MLASRHRHGFDPAVMRRWLITYPFVVSLSNHEQQSAAI
jgi:hypothetical protein